MKNRFRRRLGILGLVLLALAAAFALKIEMLVSAFIGFLFYPKIHDRHRG